MGAEVIGLRFMMETFEKAGFFFPGCGDGLVFQDACDSSPLCRSVLALCYWTRALGNGVSYSCANPRPVFRSVKIGIGP